MELSFWLYFLALFERLGKGSAMAMIAICVSTCRDLYRGPVVARRQEPKQAPGSSYFQPWQYDGEELPDDVRKRLCQVIPLMKMARRTRRCPGGRNGDRGAA